MPTRARVPTCTPEGADELLQALSGRGIARGRAFRNRSMQMQNLTAHTGPGKDRPCARVTDIAPAHAQIWQRQSDDARGANIWVFLTNTPTRRSISAAEMRESLQGRSVFGYDRGHLYQAVSPKMKYEFMRVPSQ